jgi:hypothetical protein
VADTASRAARPMGGAFGAPGHRARHVVRGSYASKLTLASYRQAAIERSRLDKGSFHMSITPVRGPGSAPPPSTARLFSALTLQYVIDMSATRIWCLLALLCSFAVGTTVVNAELKGPRLTAFASSGDVFVDFAITAPVVEGLDVGFLEVNPTVVKWEIDLKPAGVPNVHYWWDRAIRRSILEVMVRPLKAPGTCETSRQLNGRWIEARQVTDCARAYRAITSFDLPVFTLAGVNPGRGPFDVTIRGTVTVGGSVTMKTPVLARARVLSSINSPR